MHKIILISASLLPIVFGNSYESSSQGYGQNGIHSIYPNEYHHPMSYEEHYPPQPYKFGYDIKDGYGGTMNQNEEGDSYGNKKGSYGYIDSYGIYRQVDYVADKDGFRATIKTNEPGTANQNPASVYIHSNASPGHYESGGIGYQSASYLVPNQYISGLYKSASYSIPSYSVVKSPSLINAVTAPVSPAYQMPILYLAPKTIYKNMAY